MGSMGAPLVHGKRVISDRTLDPPKRQACRVGGVVVARVQCRDRGQSSQISVRKEREDFV